MQLGVDLIRISPDDWMIHPPPDPMPEYDREIWIYDAPNADAVFILLERQPDGAFRVGIAQMVCGHDEPTAALICERRLEPPCPPARTTAGEVLPFGVPAALAWAVDWIERQTAP